MVVKMIDMKDELETLSKKTKQLRETFEKSYVRGNETIEFKEEFLQKQNQVETLFTSAENEQDLKSVAKSIVDIGNELRILEKLFSVSSMFVLPQVHSMCDDLIWSFEDRLAILKKYHLLNKRVVKEVEKPTVKPANNNNHSNTSSSSSNTNINNVANNNLPAKPQTNTKLIRNTTEFGQYKRPTAYDKVYTLENLSGVALTLTQRVINSNRVLLTGLTSCNVKINFPLESLQILFCKYCQILVGQVVTSFIKNTHNSMISINGNKIRIEYCESTLFKIPTKSNAIIKECYNLEFTNYELENDKKQEETIVNSAKQADKGEEENPSNSEDKLGKENGIGLPSDMMTDAVFTSSTV